MRNRITYFILASWFSMTCLLDFVVIPALFRNISNFFEAGKLGIKLFSTFNYIELIFSVVILINLIKRGDLKKYILAFFLLGLSLLYFFYLTPSIVKWAALWEAHTPTSSFHHQLYRYLEIFKLILLGLFIGLMSKKTSSDK